MINGILIIDKPHGITSHGVVARLRRTLGIKRIGHTGTLDPFATGVLVMLVGKASRLAQFLNTDRKAYDATIEFGFETDTGDYTGEKRGESLDPQTVKQRLDLIDWTSQLSKFTGEIQQIPPMYSAKKIGGKKLYELARAGEEIERKAINVSVSSAIMSDAAEESRSVNQRIFRVECSAGTYVRTLAEDIGRSVNIPCHLSALRRTRAGRFDISQAIMLDQVGRDEELPVDAVVSMNDAVIHLEEIKLDSQQLVDVSQGKRLRFDFEVSDLNAPFRLTDGMGNLAAIGYFDETENAIKPRIVMI